MRYIVVDDFLSPQLVLDIEGNTLVFDTLEEAEKEAESCQNGIVVPLTQIIPRLKKAASAIEELKLDLYDAENLMGDLEQLTGDLVGSTE